MNTIALLLAAVQPLWPSLEKMPLCQPEQIAAPIEETREPGFDRSAHRMPYLDWSEPAKNPNGTCVILISGGGYNSTCDRKAFLPIERKMLDAGITCVWLWYRTPRPKGAEIYRAGWIDGQRAVRLVRAAAKERGFSADKIGVFGCSAGSHLSVMLATSALTPAYEPVDELDKLPCDIAFALPMCPAYALTDGLAAQNTRQGQTPDVKLNPSFRFDAKTCPICLFHGGNDPYSPNGSTAIYRQLRRMKIPAEVHIDPDRGHGTCGPVRFERALEFLRQLGFLGKLENPVLLTDRFTAEVPFRYRAKHDIWPAGKMPDVQTNQCTPWIEWFVPSNLTTRAIQIIYSGGSYTGNAPDGFEVCPARRYLNANGMAVVTMKYRTPRPLPSSGLQKHVTAWQDLQRAIRLVREAAPAHGLDPNRIGIMGSSAGGHLTLMGVTTSRTRAYLPIDDLDRKVACNVQWGVGIYPAYALTDGAERPNATGGNDDCARLVPEFAFDPDTCPMVFIHGDADGWAAMNSVKAWEQMRRMGVQSELHTLAKRNHCFQKSAAPGTASYTWLDRIWDFLSHKGFNK